MVVAFGIVTALERGVKMRISQERDSKIGLRCHFLRHIGRLWLLRRGAQFNKRAVSVLHVRKAALPIHGLRPMADRLAAGIFPECGNGGIVFL